MAIAPISKRKLAAIKSGAVKLQGSTTFERMSAEEYRAKDQAHKKELWDALYAKPKPGKSQRSRAMNTADRWFSMFIRLRDSDQYGRVTCITCSYTNGWRYLQCGHFVTRGHQSTRYDERNCNAQCRGCNYNGGQHLKHAAAIDRKYPQRIGSVALPTSMEVATKATMPCKRTEQDFLYIAQDYRERVEEIRREQPTKFKAA